jgi:hypothetical protein
MQISLRSDLRGGAGIWQSQSRKPIFGIPGEQRPAPMVSWSWSEKKPGNRVRCPEPL